MEHENRERIVRLEERIAHERERTDYLLGGLGNRLHKIETAPTVTERVERVLGSGPVLKLLLAVAITLLAFLVSGDPRTLLQAMKAARAGVGLP